MNNNNSNINDFQKDDDSFDLIKNFKYFFLEVFFIVNYSMFFHRFLINRYTPKVYISSAKIQILDKKQNNLEMPSAEDLFSSSKINLENEIEIIKSSSILNEVIKNLNLNLFVGIGDIMTSRVSDYPFKINKIYQLILLMIFLTILY